MPIWIGYLNTNTMEFKKISMTNSAGFEVHSIYPLCQKNNIVNEIFPFLSDIRDDEGLYSMSALLERFDLFDDFISNKGYLKSKDTDYTIMFHPFLRRSYSYLNEFNPYIVNLLEELYSDGVISDYLIALDENTIMQTSDWHLYHEREYWFGPKFNNDIPQNKQEVAKYISSLKENCLNGSSFTEYYWKSKKDGIIQLEIEELTSAEQPNIDNLYGCRYIHSLYDSKNMKFNHIDGSIRIYDSYHMQSRVYNTIDCYPKKEAQYKKLFRTDGSLPLKKWKMIIQGFLTYNESVNQYFNEE